MCINLVLPELDTEGRTSVQIAEWQVTLGAGRAGWRRCSTAPEHQDLIPQRLLNNGQNAFQNSPPELPWQCID